MTKVSLTVAACGALLWAGMALAGVTARAKCEATKNQQAGKYSFCLQKAQAKLVKTKGACSTTSTTACYRHDECPLGEACNKDLTKYNEATGECLSTLTDNWAKAEKKVGACPEYPLQVGDFIDAIDTYTQNIATELDTGSLVLGDGSRLKTGQTGCWGSGGMISCSGTGQDGELQKGLARSYTDNGDGTITDNRTGLMWEKKSNDGSIHDMDNTYAWENAFSVFILALNTKPCFAGHCDWRLPNVNELQSLADYGRTNPAIDPVFNTCEGVCTVLTCSCTQSGSYLSSTTALDPHQALVWLVSFAGGGVAEWPQDTEYVRAVRGGF